MKHWQNIFHVILNGNSIVQHTVPIKGGIMKRFNASIKIVASAKKIIAGILVHVFVRIASI